MRYAAYAAVSAALAAAVVFHAFNQRPNFYSATVYLAQSQACRMILLNLVLLSAYSLVRTLQKLLYGPLRAIEREQLWDKSWYAITETALAMTTFRDEVGLYFMVMFVSLLAGKVWSWMSEGRVDILEQQPPSNPRLFHARLITSLIISELFAVVMLKYCVNTLLDQPRPGMMVMFAFEFAVLLITATSILMRYLLTLQETLVVRRQTKEKLEERREEIRALRIEAEQQATQNSGEAVAAPASLPREEDIDEHDVDVPGWQEKGRWILFLDLFTDFLKLIVYMLFFSLLLLFHGIPIHIIRDVYVTTRSFVKRISDFQKYRNATRDMNEKYPDATAQELERDGTCIICREDMRPWEQPGPPALPAAGARRPARSSPDERQRPKKLPCGHILHLGCLRSWLERQQVCPTCRTSVLAPRTLTPAANVDNNNNNNHNIRQGFGREAAARGPVVPGAPGQAGQLPPNPGQHPPGEPVARARTFNIGPWRFTFAAGNAGQVRDTMRRINQGQPPAVHPPNAVNAENAASATTSASNTLQLYPPNGGSSAVNMQSLLLGMEQQLIHEIEQLQMTGAQLENVRSLQVELARLRGQTLLRLQPEQRAFLHPQNHYMAHGSSLQQSRFNAPLSFPQLHPQPQFQTQAFGSSVQQTALGPGHPALPSGMTLPEGWNLLPLQRLGAPPQDSTYHSQPATESPLVAGHGQVELTPQITQQAPVDRVPTVTAQNVDYSNTATTDLSNTFSRPNADVQASRLANTAGEQKLPSSSSPDATLAATPLQSGTSAGTSGDSSDHLLTRSQRITRGHPVAAEEPSVPDWSGEAARSTDQGSSSSRPGVSTDREASLTETTGNPTGSHGKGRAATVEDTNGEGAT